MDFSTEADYELELPLENIPSLMEAIAHVRTLLDRHIAANQEQENSNFDSDLDLEEIAEACGLSPALNTLGETFDLSLFECLILLACVGQAIDPDFPDLYAIAHNKAEVNYPTFQLACQCFPDPHWDAFTEYRPLRRWQLVHCATSPELPRACLQIDEAILHYLMGEPYHDPLLLGIVSPVYAPATDTLQPSYQKIVDQGVAIFRTPTSTWPIVQLCGTLRESQRQIAATISEEFDLPVYSISSTAIPSDRTELQSLIMRWQRWFKLAPSLLLVEVNESASLGEGSRFQAIDAFLQSVKVPVLVATDERLQLSHPVVITFDVAALDYDEQLQLWQNAWGDPPLPPLKRGEIGSDPPLPPLKRGESEESDRIPEFDQQLQRLAAQFRLSAAMIKIASAAVQSQLQVTPESGLETQVLKETGFLEKIEEIGDRLWDFCRLQARPQLEGLAQRINVRATWDDFVLPEKEKKILGQILTHVRKQSKVYQNWGFARKNQRGLGLTVLFAGTSGTGKTTAAEVLANELNLDLYRIDLSSIMSKYIGETEKNLRRIFDAAETGGGILLFDEADALFGKRTQVKDSHDRHANIEVSYLLQRMEAYQGLAILTTNLKDNLDTAFMRRLRFIVNFPFPKAAERSEIWQRAFPKQTPTEGLNYKRLGQLDIAGGNIKSIALNAAFLAADANEPVMMKHILEATRTEYLKTGRSLSSLETKGWNV